MSWCVLVPKCWLSVIIGPARSWTLINTRWLYDIKKTAFIHERIFPSFSFPLKKRQISHVVIMLGRCWLIMIHVPMFYLLGWAVHMNHERNTFPHLPPSDLPLNTFYWNKWKMNYCSVALPEASFLYFPLLNFSFLGIRSPPLSTPRLWLAQIVKPPAVHWWFWTE